MTAAFMETIFCDDVRTEIGHKLSYMGVYGSNVLLREFPATLPKLCAVMSLHLPEDTNANVAVFSLLKDDEEVGRATVQIEDVRKAATPPREIDGARRLTIRFIAQISPLKLDAPGRLKARADVDGTTVSGGTLLFEFLPAGYVA
jgi:hypothetical protein